MLMGVVQLFDAGLGCAQPTQSFLHTRVAGLGYDLRGCLRYAESHSAAALHLVDVGVEGADFAAQILLVGDAPQKAVEIKRDRVGASGDQGGGQRSEQRDAAL